MSDIVKSNVFGDVANKGNIKSEIFLALGLSKEQVLNFNSFIQEDNNRESHTGLYIFPSQNNNEYMVMVDSDLSYTWRQTMLPDILDYLASQGIVVVWENAEVLDTD